MKTLSVIIPTYNGEELLRRFFPSVIAALSNYPGQKEIIITDDCSSDNSKIYLEQLKKDHENVRVVYHETNLGFAASCNTGIKHAGGAVLFFLNNDVALQPDYFLHFNKYFSDEKTFAVTTSGYYYDSKLPLDGLKIGKWKKGFPRVTYNAFEEELIEKRIPKPYRSFSVQGAYFFADAEKVKQLGGFDELLSPYVYEETDLAYRALKRGWNIYYEPACKGYHAVSSTLSRSKPFKRKVIACRNRIIFVWKNIHAPRLMFSHLFFLLLKLLTLNRIYIKATWLALKKLDSILGKRKEEKVARVITDEQLFFRLNKP